ncbi:hypothetical protein JCM6882_009236 [Rhodosporidiobolus microsporus]
MTTLLRVYSRSFERSPYLTLCVANGVLSSIGDVTAQMLPLALGAGPVAFDPSRTLRFLVFGASMGPLGGAWNKFLEVNFPLRPIPAHGRIPAIPTKVKVEDPPEFPIPGLKGQLPKGARLERAGGAGGKGEKSGPGVMQEEVGVSVVQLAKRVAADQLGLAPVSLLIFLLSMSVLEGLDDEETKQKIKDNYWAILSVNWQVWPILQLINFRYVPLPYRVPFGSICGIAWTCFLSWQTNREE